MEGGEAKGSDFAPHRWLHYMSNLPSNASSPVSESGDWYKGGYETPVEARSSASSSKVFRFFLKAGDPASEITFLDSAPHPSVIDEDGKKLSLPSPFIVYEHNWEADGRWNNTATCLKSATNSICPYCDAIAKSPSQSAFYTIIDHREVISKKGTKFKDDTMLFVVKTSSNIYTMLRNFGEELETEVNRAKARLKEAQEAGDERRVNRARGALDEAMENLERYNLTGLRGARFSVSRSVTTNGGPKTASIGDAYRFVGWTELEGPKVTFKTVQPFNYIKLLKPKSIEEAAAEMRSLGKAIELSARSAEVPAY